MLHTLVQIVPAVITAVHVSVAELSALRLDGECLPLDEAVVPIDEPVTARHRALALAVALDRRLVAERASALWVYGCLARPPVVHTACIPRDHRTRLRPSRRVLVRETNVTSKDVHVIAGLAVTTPARTLFDLALQAEPLDAVLVTAAARLTEAEPWAMTGAAQATRAAHHTPGRSEALRRLAVIGERALSL